MALYVSFGRPFARIVAVGLGTFFALKYTRIALVAELDEEPAAPASPA